MVVAKVQHKVLVAFFIALFLVSLQPGSSKFWHNSVRETGIYVGSESGSVEIYSTLGEIRIYAGRVNWSIDAFYAGNHSTSDFYVLNLTVVYTPSV